MRKLSTLPQIVYIDGKANYLEVIGAQLHGVSTFGGWNLTDTCSRQRQRDATGQVLSKHVKNASNRAFQRVASFTVPRRGTIQAHVSTKVGRAANSRNL